MKAALRRILIGALGVALLCVAVGWAHVRGALVKARPPAEIEALLAPHEEVYRPDGPGPFPALVLLHGCGGLRDSLRQWAEEIRSQGVLVVAPNSYAGRGIAWQEVCSARRLLGNERAGDAWVSLARVRARADVDPARVALAGWSHGAWSLMELLSLRDGDLPPSLSAAPTSLDGVAGLILFYPYCGFLSAAQRTWSSPVPTLMLLAGADSVVSASECASWGEARAQEGRPVTTHVYPGVDHGFDQAVPSGEWELTWDPTAGEDARRRVIAFLREHLGPLEPASEAHSASPLAGAP